MTTTEMTEMMPSQNTTKVDEEDVREGTVHKRCKNLVKNKKCIIGFIAGSLITIAIIVTVVLIKTVSTNHRNNQGKYILE